MKKPLSVLLALVMAAALVLPVFSLFEFETAAKAAPEGGRDPEETVTIMVKLEDPPVLKNYGADDPRFKSASENLREKQRAVIESIEALPGFRGTLDLKYSYTLLFNGFSFRGEYRLINEIIKLKGVKNCYESWTYELPEEIEPEEPGRLATSVGWISANSLWAMGYTGQGQTIAVIDTGIKKEHPNFSAAPQDPHFTSSGLQTILDQNELCAEERFSGTLTGHTLYYSAKIPFTFNYVTGTTDVSHATADSDHGTHVSSICAGSDSSARGVAYNAQIISMQVFNNGDGDWADILAALEDCAYLRVDSLNMSLGADCGFTHDDDIDPVFDLLTAAGVNCSVAAGNSGFAGSGSLFNGTNPTFNFDTGVVSTPSTAPAALSVAASNDDSAHSLASYSSWGSTSDLRIKPEIMAPGSNIYAATDPAFSGGSYGTKSGTSMATPHIAGAMALVGQYVDANFPGLNETAKMKMVNTLLMCTAVPSGENGVYYSPRAQGSGQADLLAAISTPAYVNVRGCDRPKIELGDDDDELGVYHLSFDVKNFSSSPVTYTVDPIVMTEATNQWLIQLSLMYIMDHRDEVITPYCSVTAPSSITVPAGETVTVSITVDVSPYADELLEKYPLGAYIEGYVMLRGNVDLTVPFLGFFGDWEYSALFDRKCYFDNYLGTTLDYPNQWGTNVAGTSLSGSSTGIYLGVNPFADTQSFLLDRASISPNGDGNMDSISTVYTYMLRNAEIFRYEVVDANTGEQYYLKDIPFVPKAIENSWLSYYQPVGAEEWTRMDPWDGAGLPDGTSVILRMTGFMQGVDDFDPAENEFASWEVPVTVDRTAPSVNYWRLENGELTVYISDNHYTAYVGVYSNASCTQLIAEEVVEEDQRGALTIHTFNVGNRQTVYLKVGDYAYNVTAQTVTEGEGGSLDPVDLQGVHFGESAATIYEGSSMELRLLRDPADANNFDTVWTSGNPNIASVTGGPLKATVTGISQGVTNVSATATDRRTGQSFTAVITITVEDYPTFDEAANAPGSGITFYTGGSYPWTVDFVDGNACVRSTNQQENTTNSSFETETLWLEAGDKLIFRWMVSSESSYDRLKFLVNYGELDDISGDVGWTDYTYTVQSSGSYTFRWEYAKDSSVSTGADTGWVDDIRVEYVNPTFIPGDCDLNGTVAVNDALLALRHFMGLSALSGNGLLAADVNGDGTVTIADALLIMRRAMGLIAEF